MKESEVYLFREILWKQKIMLHNIAKFCISKIVLYYKNTEDIERTIKTLSLRQTGLQNDTKVFPRYWFERKSGKIVPNSEK